VYNTKDLDYRTWEVRAPIATIHVPLYKSLEKWIDFDELGLIDINGEKVICITYVHSEKIEWDNEFGIGDISTPTNWGFDLPNGISGEFSNTIVRHVPVETAQSDAYITSAELTSLKFNLSITVPNNLMANVITITIPHLRDQNNAIFTKTYNNLLSGVHNMPVENLIGYKLETPNKEVQISCDFTVSSTGGGSTAGRLSADMSISDIEVNYMKGYFGKLEYDEHVEMEFDFFDNLDFDGTVGIRDIMFKVDVVNSIGAPLDIEARQISFVNDNGDETKLVEPFSFKIPSATELGNYTIAEGKTSHTEKLSAIEFAKDNYPAKVVFDFFGTLNPEGDKGGSNFIIKSIDTLAKANFTLTVPLHFKMSAYNRIDTVAFDYNKIINDNERFSKSIDSFVLTLAVDNGLPFDVNLKADLIDEAGEVVEVNLVNANINAKQKSPIEIIIEKYQFERYRTKEVKNLVLYTKAQTANEDYVRVTENDYIDIVVSTSFKSDIPLNLF